MVHPWLSVLNPAVVRLSLSSAAALNHCTSWSICGQMEIDLWLKVIITLSGRKVGCRWVCANNVNDVCVLYPEGFLEFRSIGECLTAFERWVYLPVSYLELTQFWEQSWTRLNLCLGNPVYLSVLMSVCFLRFYSNLFYSKYSDWCSSLGWSR